MIRMITLRMITLLFLASGFIANAQMAVSKEPRHKTVLENSYLRLLDVHIKPGDTTFFHHHFLPSVIVFLTDTKIGTQISGEHPVISQTQTGNTVYAGYQKKPIVHHVWDDDSTVFHVMDIELLRNDSVAAIHQMQSPLPGAIFKENLVIAYRITLKPNEGFKLLSFEYPLLFICTSGSGSITVNNSYPAVDIQPGKFYWINKGNSFGYSGGKDGASYTVLQLNE
jgi:hypothetical protein